MDLEEDGVLGDETRNPFDREVLTAYLQRHRRGAATAFAVCLGGLSAILIFPKQLLGVFAAAGSFDDWWSPLLVLGAFFALQGAFLWGGFAIRRRGSGGSATTRTVVAVVIVAGMLGLLTAGAIMVFLEYGNHLRPPLSEDAPYGAGTWLRHMVYDVGAFWVVWIFVLLAHTKGRDKQTVLWRLLELVFAGSWAEFVIAASVHLVIYRTRDEHSTCRCYLGTWLALCFSLPILIWSIGPAVALLYVREYTMTKRAPHGRWLRLLVDRLK